MDGHGNYVVLHGLAVVGEVHPAPVLVFNQHVVVSRVGRLKLGHAQLRDVLGAEAAGVRQPKKR